MSFSYKLSDYYKNVQPKGEAIKQFYNKFADGEL